MSKKRPCFKTTRIKAYKAQSGLCYYCSQPMWEQDINKFMQKYSIPINKAKLLQSTAEHLVPRCEGGSDQGSNIVAACKFCNINRHKSKKPLDPPNYQNRVLNRLSQNAWHMIQLNPITYQQKALN